MHDNSLAVVNDDDDVDGTAYLIADHGACVHDCPPDRYSNNSVCVECNGPCPKCELTPIHVVPISWKARELWRTGHVWESLRILLTVEEQ